MGGLNVSPNAIACLRPPSPPQGHGHMGPPTYRGGPMWCQRAVRAFGPKTGSIGAKLTMTHGPLTFFSCDLYQYTKQPYTRELVTPYAVMSAHQCIGPPQAAVHIYLLLLRTDVPPVRLLWQSVTGSEWSPPLKNNNFYWKIFDQKTTVILKQP